MFRNYLVIALRNLRKRRGYSFINICGLAIGLMCCLFILLYILDEQSFDRYHAKADRIYRLTIDLGVPGSMKYLAMVGPMVGPDLKADYPSVTEATRFLHGSFLFQRQDNPNVQYQEYDGLYADASVFDVFSFPWLEGDKNSALVEPYSVVLTEATARRYFGEDDPVGKVLVRNGQQSYTVTGVIGEVPEQSHFSFDLLVSLSTGQALFPDLLTEWYAFLAHTYILVENQTEMQDLEAGFTNYVRSHVGDSTGEDGATFTIRAEPLTDIYLHSTYHSSLSRRGNINTLYIFSGVAIFILLIACINFLNLSTARATERAREVGLRKVIGARRRQLTVQFLGEAVLLAMVALFIALFLVELISPFFNAFSGKSVSLAALSSPGFALCIIGVTVGMGVIAGGYPAFILSRFRPITVLRGAFQQSKYGILLRKSLVVFQFALSIALMVSTGMITSQVDFMRNKHLGFDKEKMLVLSYHGDPRVQQQLNVIQQELLRHQDVHGASISGDIPGTGNLHEGIMVEDMNGVLRGSSWRYMSVDYDFIDNYNMEMIAGRAFDAGIPLDSTQAMLINETAVAALGFVSVEDALGKKFEQGERQGEIIGVVKDFHLKSLQQEVEPVYMLINPDRFQYISLRLNTDDISRTLMELEAQWQRLVPHRPFEYSFLDQSFGRQYQAEEQFSKVVTLFTTLAIFVACLGLFGLATLTMQQRTREVSMRKVLGAPLAGLLLLLTKDFIKLVCIAFIISAPIAYMVVNSWLENFPYQTTMDYGLFFIAGCLAILIAVLTISYQAIKTVRTNPVEIMRHE